MTDGYKIGYWRCSAWFLGLSIAIPAASFLVKLVFGIELGQFAGSIIPVMIASMMEGVQFSRGTKRLPSRKERLLIARMLTAISIAWSSVLVFVVILLAPGLGEFVASTLGPALLLGMILVLIAFFFFLSWLFLGMGAKNEMKMIDVPSAKDFE